MNDPLRHVLTAKHCFFDDDGNNIYEGRKRYVKVNVHDITSRTDYEEVLVKDIAWVEDNEHNDIGMIILSRPVNLDEKNIGTVCLPSSAKEVILSKLKTISQIDSRFYMEISKICNFYFF